MNEWWNRDPFNNRYAGGENNSLLARDRRDSIVGARAGNPVIWPYNASGVQNRPGAVAAQQGQDVPSAPNTNRTFGNQDTPSAPQGSQPTPPVTPTPPAPTPPAPTPPTPPAPFGANVRPSGMGPAYDPLRPPGTPFAPTAAQVAANPSAYAGTSFDPGLRAQFQPNTALANSTTQDTVGSDGQVIRGFQPYIANQVRFGDPNAIPGWNRDMSIPVGTVRDGQTLIWGPYQGTYGSRWVNTADLNSGRAFLDALSADHRASMTPEQQAEYMRSYAQSPRAAFGLR